MFKTAFIAAALLTAATPALASNTAVPQVDVRIDDLDLARATDRDRLDQRIDNAARRLCVSGARGIDAIRAEQRCIALVRAEAAPQTERAVAMAQSGRRLATTDAVTGG